MFPVAQKVEGVSKRCAFEQETKALAVAFSTVFRLALRIRVRAPSCLDPFQLTPHCRCSPSAPALFIAGTGRVRYGWIECLSSPSYSQGFSLIGL